MSDCRTNTPLKEIAFCLLNGKCGSRSQGGCAAAIYLIGKLQGILPKPYPCLVTQKEISCTLCLKRVISNQCSIFESCQSPFPLALKKVNKLGAGAFEYCEVTDDFTIINEKTKLKFRVSRKVLVPWEENPKQTSPQEVAEVIIENCPPPPKSFPPEVSELESSRWLQVKRSYVYDPKGKLECEQCFRQVHTLYKRGRRGVCSRCVELGKQSPPSVESVGKERSKLPSPVKAEQLKTLFGQGHCKKLEGFGLTTIEDVCRSIKAGELSSKIGSKVSASRIIRRLERAGIEVS